MAARDRGSGARIDDPNYWRARAETARRAAEKMVDPEARQTMLAISKSCEDFAKRTRARMKATRSRRSERTPRD